jgi:hypothetical protein
MDSLPNFPDSFEEAGAPTAKDTPLQGKRDPLAIRYTAQREDVGALLRYNLRHSPRLWVVLIIVAVLPAGVATAASLMSGRWPRAGEIVFDLIVGVVLVAVMLLRARARTKSDERVLSIGPEGIHTTIGKRSADLPWTRIASVDVTSEHIFITGKNANGFAIPSRAFASQVERTEFLDAMETFRNEGDK